MESNASRRLTRHQWREAAWQMRLSGLTVTQIARRLGVDQFTISRDLDVACREYSD